MTRKWAANDTRDIHITETGWWWFGTCFTFPYIGNNHPIWLRSFKGVEITNHIHRSSIDYPYTNHILIIYQPWGFQWDWNHRLVINSLQTSECECFHVLWLDLRHVRNKTYSHISESCRYIVICHLYIYMYFKYISGMIYLESYIFLLWKHVDICI